MLNDESRVQALGFQEMSNQLVDESGRGSWLFAGDMVLGALFFVEFLGFL